jgi:hypothetical protein
MQSYIRFASADEVHDGLGIGSALKSTASNVLLHVELDVPLLKIVVVYLDRSLCGSCSKVDVPGRLPFSAPVVLEVEVVARDLYFHRMTIGEDSVGRCALSVLSAQVSVHSLHYFVSQLDHL